SRHPLRQRGPRTLLEAPFWRSIIEKRRGYGAIGIRDQHLAAIEDLAQPAAIRSFDTAEERGQSPELVAGPTREGMIMALGAFQLHTEKHARGGRRQILRLRSLGRVKRQRTGSPVRVIGLGALTGGGPAVERSGQQFV